MWGPHHVLSKRQSSASLCSVLNSFASIARAAVSLALELWSTSQVLAQVAWKRNILETRNDDILLLLRAQLGVPALR